MTGFRERFGDALMEGVGTFLFLFTIQVSSGTLAPVAIGGVLITLVYAGGDISGGHYNPAISLAINLRGKLSGSEMVTYWIFQLVGGWLGALVGGVVGGDFTLFAGGDSFIRAFLAEVIFTFALCFVVLTTATTSKSNNYYGAAIGLTVMAGAIAVGDISGGAFNPAVALSLALSKFDNFFYAVSVSFANLIGGALSALVFYMVAPGEFDPPSTEGERTSLNV